MLAYFLKVNVAIVLFYAFYRLFFYKDTFFGWRRTALLCFFAVSAAIPLLNIQTWITEQEPMVAMADLYASVVLPELSRHRSDSGRLEKRPFRICQYQLSLHTSICLRYFGRNQETYNSLFKRTYQICQRICFYRFQSTQTE